MSFSPFPSFGRWGIPTGDNQFVSCSGVLKLILGSAV